MIIIDAPQGSDAWRIARMGIATASCFDKIITPKELAVSKSQPVYRAHLLAEWFLGRPLDDSSSGFMERGTEMEKEAAAFYAVANDAELREVGFCRIDDAEGGCGCSPDRLVGDDGGLEIKCPSAGEHMLYYLNPEALRVKYWSQVQGELYVTDRKWFDLFSYHPTFPRVTVRVEPDDKWQTAFDRELCIFNRTLAGERERLAPDRDAYRARMAQDAIQGEAEIAF